MKYFVTGATGFVGNVLARKLREAGHEVHASVRSLEKAKEIQAIGVKLFKGDVTDKESMREAMTGVDGVFHVAGWYKIGTRDKSDGERVNVQGTRNVLELMKELNIPKGVYTSTCAINSDTKGKVVDESYRFNGKHLSEYDRTKAVAHDIAIEFIKQGLPLVIVMPGLIYGPGDTSTLRTNIIDFLKGRLPMLPTETAFCWGHVDDISRGHVQAMEKGKSGEVYIIAGEPYRIIDAFKLASQITGKRAPMTVPYQVMKILSALVKPFDGFLPETYTSEGLRVVAGVTYWGDNSKAKRGLGYSPRPFCEAWEETLHHEMKLAGM
ncbi:MAG: NAD-dependent epimerase/dehydratase family protein [Anaerolineae bacterium]|nr:NAD-dependent epimerase/dehydratase family protein [Anaerolineae bacterium]MCI0608651.1 NAD-dependent epimerase/dehydratase family protein [Anaerolineae bacterium]